jgi:hypothetical protein
MKKQLEKDIVTAHVKYRDVEQTFTGNANDVWVCLNRFFSEMIPALDLVRKITLSVDLDRLLDDLKGIVAVAPEGLELLASKQKLTDNETLLLNLLAAYIGYKIGKLEREWLTKEELQTKLGKSMKITSTRLGELTREGIVLKTDEGNYRITTKGVIQTQQELLPKIRTKL